MKKTLLVTLDFYPNVGGVAAYWKNIGERLPSSQWVVFAPLLQKGERELSAPYPIIRRALLSRFLFPRWLPLFFHILSACRAHHIERIIVGHILPTGTVVWILSALFHIPFIVSAHGLDIAAPRAHKRKKFLCSAVLHAASWVVVNSKATAAVVHGYGVSEKKIQYVYPAPSITPALLKESRGSPALPDAVKNMKIILTVGRLVKRKGHAYVLRALPGVLAREPDVFYCIIGDGPYRQELEALTAELNIGQHVLFTGVISSEEIAQWYTACRVFIMTPEDIEGDIEGFGIVYLEAQSFGKPVIGTRVSGVVEAVADGETGILVEQRDTSAIQREIIHLLTDVDFSQKLGEAGKHRVAENFQWKHQAEKLQYLLSL
ncbi:glycosyltransferase family 4 protein [Candidatus Uhrbacteria bacterium]|nr:glycosyltransferase family 4 protein [Candidatus Uhrbacteria bacterium]